MHPNFMAETGEGAAKSSKFIWMRPLLGRDGRMNIKSGVARLQSFEDRPIRLLVEISSAKMRIDDRAIQTKGFHAALDLRNRTVDVLRREYGQARKAIWIAAACGGKAVIGESGKCRAFLWLED